MAKLVIAFLALFAARLFAQSSDANIGGYFEQGEKALAEGRLSDAEATYLKLEKLAPNMAEVYGRLGLIYFQERRFEEAIPALRQAMKLKPSLPNTDLLLAMALSEMGRFPDALPGLEKGFHHGTDTALKRMCGLQLERAYTGMRRDSDAVQTALELMRAFPNDPEVLYHSGRLFGNYAYMSMQKLAEVAPDSVWRHEAAADAYQSSGNRELAIAEYRQVLAQAPHRPGIHFRLGRALLPQSASEAAGEFEAELALDPTNSNAAYELAEIHRKAGELDQARDLFAAALKYYPDFEEANVGLARSLTATGKAQEAVAYLQKAARLNPRDEVAYYQLSLAYKALGKPDEQRIALGRFQQLKAENASRSDGLKLPSDVTKQEAEAQ